MDDTTSYVSPTPYESKIGGGPGETCKCGDWSIKGIPETTDNY